MRRLLESLVPHHRHLYWGWVGGMFALYLVLMVSVAGVFVRHESSRTIAQQPVTTVTIDRGEHTMSVDTMPLRQVVNH